ncbi:hypothetical protein [Bacillus sp. FJAT-45350]|uniref:hypothetical protein n=1 Tax=Bacillus sp. FJAT-45350 TaxID=2011014 RepID=UPI000BB9020B|nr:hypothetical protein [Bacillus sp. FJAT-45350]
MYVANSITLERAAYIAGLSYTDFICLLENIPWNSVTEGFYKESEEETVSLLDEIDKLDISLTNWSDLLF